MGASPCTVDAKAVDPPVGVTAADVSDRAGARLVAGQLHGRFPRLVTLFADAGYGGTPLATWLLTLGGWVLEIVRRAVDQVGFVTQPHRWIVERTFAWLGDYHRLGKDYERLPESSEALVYLAMIHLMVRRLAPAS